MTFDGDLELENDAHQSRQVSPGKEEDGWGGGDFKQTL